LCHSSLKMLKVAVAIALLLVGSSAAGLVAVYAPLNQQTDTGFSLGVLDPNQPNSANVKTVGSWNSGTLVNPLNPNLAIDAKGNAYFVESYNYGTSFSILQASTGNGSLLRNVSHILIGFFSGLQYDTSLNMMYLACLNQNFAWGICKYDITTGTSSPQMVVALPDVPIALWGSSYSQKTSQIIVLAEKAMTYGEIILWFVNVRTNALVKEVPVSVGGSLGVVEFDDVSGNLYGWVNDPLATSATLYTIDTSTGALSSPLLKVANATAFGTPIAIDPVSGNVTTVLNTGMTTLNPIVINYNPTSGGWTRAVSDLRIAGFAYAPSSNKKPSPIAL